MAASWCLATISHCHVLQSVYCQSLLFMHGVQALQFSIDDMHAHVLRPAEVL